MQYGNASNDEVHIAGDFQEITGLGTNWQTNSIKLERKIDSNHIYKRTILVPPPAHIFTNLSMAIPGITNRKTWMSSAESRIMIKILTGN